MTINVGKILPGLNYNATIKLPVIISEEQFDKILADLKSEYAMVLFVEAERKQLFVEQQQEQSIKSLLSS